MTNTQELEYKDRALRFVLEYGSVFFEDDADTLDGITDFNSGRVAASNKVAKKSLTKKLKSGVAVDLKKSTDPYQNTADFFQGTFEDVGQFVFMQADLVLKDGSKYLIAYYDPYMTLTEMIKGLESVASWKDIVQ